MLKMKTNLFADDKKIGKSLLSGPENRFKYWAVPKILHFVETCHLTMLTLLWSIINMVLGLYAKNNVMQKTTYCYYGLYPSSRQSFKTTASRSIGLNL